jgi:parvulin-like peptidyl-prolyl isomerase
LEPKVEKEIEAKVKKEQDMGFDAENLYAGISNANAIPNDKDKDGDFAVLRLKDNIPEAILKAAFALKQGEISEPVEQPGGFYLLRADEVTVQPLEKVHDDLFNQLRQEHYAKWLEAHNKATAVQFPNPAFPGDGIPAALKENKQQ